MGLWGNKMSKIIKEVFVQIKYEKGGADTYLANNTQDAQSFLQRKKCYNKEVRHQ